MIRAPLPPVFDRVRRWSQGPRVRLALRILGLALLVVGAIWSVASLDLAWGELSLGLLLLNLFILTPANLCIAAVSLRINACALGFDIPTGRSIATSAAANVAELLPLPGGAVVRGAALVNAGARVADSTRIVILTSILTLLMTVTLSLAALAVLADPAWGWLVVPGLVGIAGILFLIGRQVTTAFLGAMVGVRIVMLSLTLLRLSVAFATLGTPIGWTEAALYVAAPTLGAAVAIVPAGLGVNEAIAAGLATLIAASPASAFLSVALNRVLDLVAGAVMVFALPFIGIDRGRT